MEIQENNPSERSSPKSLLAASTCRAQTLTISDQHATILLSQYKDDTEKSLLKLTLKPFHKDDLTSSPGAQDLEADSSRIIQFLSSYNFHLTSESGAEYSYFQGAPKASFWSHYLMGFFSTSNNPKGPVQVELISPASEDQVRKHMPTPAWSLIEETPDLFQEVTRPFIQSKVENGSVAWVQNIVEGKKETERLLLDKDSYILNIDTKWRSHPDPHNTPRSEWYQHPSTQDLYCLAIAKDSGITCIRDLRAKHIPMLRSMLEDCPKAIAAIYGVPADQLRIFVHYQPQFYHFHVHFTRLHNEFGCQVERGHLVSDILQNLELDGEFYAKRNITYKLRVNDKLYEQI